MSAYRICNACSKAIDFDRTRVVDAQIANSTPGGAAMRVELSFCASCAMEYLTVAGDVVTLQVHSSGVRTAAAGVKHVGYYWATKRGSGRLSVVEVRENPENGGFYGLLPGIEFHWFLDQWEWFFGPFAPPEHA